MTDELPTKPSSLLSAVDDFVRRSHEGEFFEDFLSNAQVCMYSSNGTEDWLEQLGALLERCRHAIERDDDRDGIAAMERLFDLLAEASEQSSRIVFVPGPRGAWNPRLPLESALKVYLVAIAHLGSSSKFHDTVSRLERQLPGKVDVRQVARWVMAEGGGRG